MKNRLSLLVLMLSFICLAASGQKNNNTPQSPTPTEISLQDSIQSLRADNADLRKQLDKMEKEVEKYRWDFGQTVNDYNDKMSHWLAYLTIILAVVAIGGPYLSNKWSEKNIEKLLKDAEKKAETAQTKADEVVGSVSADANTAKEQAKKAEEFVNAAKKQAEKAEGILSTAIEEAEKSLTVVKELETQIVNELTPLKKTAFEAETLLKSVQDYFEKIKNIQVDNTTDIDKQQKEIIHEEAKNNKQQDQIELIMRVKYSDDKKTILYVPEEIENFKIPEGVTEIGGGAFRNCSCLTSIEIPNSVTEIGRGAFWGCTGIKNYIVSNNNQNYCSTDGALYSKDKAKLIRVPCDRDCFEIPNSVTVIGNSAFSNCTNLTSIVIPDSVTVIGENAFDSCTSLYSIVIPNSVTMIEGGAFHGCTSLTSIEIPDSVTEIGDSAFEDCFSLTSIVIPDSATVIGHRTFMGCKGIKNYIVSKNNPKFCSIDGSLYSKDKTKIIQVPYDRDLFKIPESVTEIGDFAFGGCTSLASIVIPNSVTEIGRCSFIGCSSLASIVISNSVPVIRRSAFRGCKSLTSIVIPNSVIAILEQAFEGCTSLTSIVIPNSVTEIWWDAFLGCSSLASIEIPDRVTKIWNRAFWRCTSLTKIHLKHTSPVDFSSAFEDLDLSKITVYVPKGSVVEYKKDPFYKQFKKVIGE